MIFNDVNYKKSFSEKYYLKFNKNSDYAIFTIDESGLFNCQSSFGNYSYKWTAFGDCFKKFLIEMPLDYLLDSIAKKTYLDFDKYFEVCKKEVAEQIEFGNLESEEGEQLLDFINSLRDESTSVIVDRIYSNKILLDLTGGEPWNSNFFPEKEFSRNAVILVKKVYPQFIEILKTEI